MLACAQEVDFIEKKLKQAQGHLDFYLNLAALYLSDVTNLTKAPNKHLRGLWHFIWVM